VIELALSTGIMFQEVMENKWLSKGKSIQY
jgi:hypothetical protein